MSDFPEPSSFNGADLRPMGSSTGKPERWRCLACEAANKGMATFAAHYNRTGHTPMVWEVDPRFHQPCQKPARKEIA